MFLGTASDSLVYWSIMCRRGWNWEILLVTSFHTQLMYALWSILPPRSLIGAAVKDHSQHTIGVEFSSRTVKLGEKRIKLQVQLTVCSRQSELISCNTSSGTRQARNDFGLWQFWRMFQRVCIDPVYQICDAQLLSWGCWCNPRLWYHKVCVHFMRRSGEFTEHFKFTCSRESFANLSRWLADARALASPHLVTVLVGNKSDREDDREVEWAEASRWAAENGMYPTPTTFFILISWHRWRCAFSGGLLVVRW
jgi:Ras family.